MPFRTKIPIPCPYDTVLLRDGCTGIVIFYSWHYKNHDTIVSGLQFQEPE
jgi:hypothetical protein